MKKNKLTAIACGAILSLTCACSDDNGPEPGDKNLVPEGEGKMEALGLTDQVAFSNETTEAVLSQLNPEAQEELLLNMGYAKIAYGELQAAAQWREFAEKVKEYLEETLTQGSMPTHPSETKAASNTVTDIYFADFAGVFTPGEGEWVRSADSKNIEFRFAGADGQEQSFVIVPSDETFLYSFVSEKWVGNDVYYTSTAFHLPTNLKASYTVHGQALAEATLDYSVVKKKDGTFDFKGLLSAKAANLAAEIDLTATNSRYTAQFTASVNNIPALKGAAVANGHHLTDLQHIMLLTKVEDVAMLVKNAECYADLLGKIQINGRIKMTERFFDVKPVITALDGLSQADAEKKVGESAKTLNKYTKVWLRFNNTRTEQSRLDWTSLTEPLPEGWACALTPLLYVPADNRSYSLEELLQRKGQ